MHTLKNYLQDYLAWVDVGAPNMHPFYRSVGLCSNIDEGGYTEEERATIKVELKARLITDFGKSIAIWPFHTENQSLFELNCHLNQKRIDWARRTLEEIK